MNGRLSRPRELRAYPDITDIRPVVADAALAEVFQLQEGTPLSNMDEVNFASNEIPVCYSKQYSADGVFRHTVLRKSCAGA